MSVAKSYLERYPKKYIKIGYIDISISENGNFIYPKKIKLLRRISTPFDWFDLLEQTNNGAVIQNLNYKTKDISNFVKLFVPSQKSVVSWSKNSSEYIVLANELHLKILDTNYIMPYDNCFSDTIKKIRKPFKNCSDYLLDLKNLKLKNEKTIKYVETLLTNYEKLCKL